MGVIIAWAVITLLGTALTVGILHTAFWLTLLVWAILTAIVLGGKDSLVDIATDFIGDLLS